MLIVDILWFQFTASMWTPEEAARIISIAKDIAPALKTFSLPGGYRSKAPMPSSRT